MRTHGRTQAMLEQMKSMRGIIAVPCVDAKHCRRLFKLLADGGFRVQKTAKINKGVMRQPHQSRRSIMIYVHN